MIGSEPVVVLEELSDGEGTVDAEVSGVEEDASLGGAEDVSVAVLPSVDVVSSAGVEVEEIKGGLCPMYVPEGCKA